MENQIDFASIVNARMIVFNMRCSSEGGLSLVKTIAYRIEAHESRKRKRRQSDQKSFLMCVEAVTAFILRSAAVPLSPWCYRSLHRQGFSDAEVGADTFIKVIRSMEALGLVTSHRGGNQANPFHQPGGVSKAYNPGLASRFKASDRLIDLADEHGVVLKEVDTHFHTLKPTKVIICRPKTKKEGRFKKRSRSISFERDDRTKYLERKVLELNDYLYEQELGGGLFTGYQRIFNEGDHPAFNWDRGGRLYCVGDDNYQLLKKEERLKMTINGERVAEIDINASYLTILLSQLGGEIPSDGDIYNIDGLPREVVKAWVTATLGFDGFHDRWPVGLTAALRKGGINTSRRLTMKTVEERVLKAIPALTKWPTSGLSWSQLMYMDSTQVQIAMEKLRNNHNIPSYSVHDSLIVRRKDVNATKAELKQSYKVRFGVECRLSVSVA